MVVFQGKQNPSEISPPQPYNICTIMYTSGTSGNPKGVVLTHETIAFSVRGIDLFLEQFEDKVSMIFEPGYISLEFTWGSTSHCGSIHDWKTLDIVILHFLFIVTTIFPANFVLTYTFVSLSR